MSEGQSEAQVILVLTRSRFCINSQTSCYFIKWRPDVDGRSLFQLRSTGRRRFVNRWVKKSDKNVWYIYLCQSHTVAGWWFLLPYSDMITSSSPASNWTFCLYVLCVDLGSTWRPWQQRRLELQLQLTHPPLQTHLEESLRRTTAIYWGKCRHCRENQNNLMIIQIKNVIWTRRAGLKIQTGCIWLPGP